MLMHCRRGTVVLATRDPELENLVLESLAALGDQAPRLTRVGNMGDCIVAVRLLSPCCVFLDDGIQDAPGPGLVEELHQTQPAVAVIYIASRHTLDLERDVRRQGVLFYIARPEGSKVLRAHLASVLQGLLRRTG